MAKFDLSLLPPNPDFVYEQTYWNEGRVLVAGIDEAGRGPLAGPVAAGAVIFPANPGLTGQLEGVRDSKELNPNQRAACAEVIRKLAITCAVGFASSEEIDLLGILPATYLAIKRAMAQLSVEPQALLLDFISLPGDERPQISLVKGDARSLSIAAASILAKTERDRLLQELDSIYPGYGFAQNKGYGTAEHYAAIERLGPCSIHRKSFAPFRPVID